MRFPLFPRIRDIVDHVGTRLRVSIDACPDGALTVIEDPARPGTPRVLLDACGTELLGGYIMSARLALSSGLPDEFTAGAFAASFHLAHDPEPAIVIRQPDGGRFAIPATFWDKLYAELCMVIAHSRRFDREPTVRLH